MAQRSRNRLVLICLIIVGIASCFGVLFVNDAFRWSTKAPRIFVNFEDRCNSIEYASALLRMEKKAAYLIIEAKNDTTRPCPFKNFALITFEDLVTTRGEAHNWTRFELEGEPKWYKIDYDDLRVGFGKLAIQVFAITRRFRDCVESGTGIELEPMDQLRGKGAPAEVPCASPLEVAVEFSHDVYDVSSALPTTFVVGATSQFTKVAWRGRPAWPAAGVAHRTIASAEVRLNNRFDQLIQETVTVTGSSVFGAVLSVLVGMLGRPLKTGGGLERARHKFATRLRASKRSGQKSKIRESAIPKKSRSRKSKPRKQRK